MKALLFHCQKFKTEVKELARRPKGIVPENLKDRKHSMQDCILAYVTVEGGDNLEANSLALVKEIKKMVKETGHNRVVLYPFAHLSNNLAKSADAKKALALIKENLEKTCTVIRVHFGSHKETLVHTYGHRGNVKYREFK